MWDSPAQAPRRSAIEARELSSNDQVLPGDQRRARAHQGRQACRVAEVAWNSPRLLSRAARAGAWGPHGSGRTGFGRFGWALGGQETTSL